MFAISSVEASRRSSVVLAIWLPTSSGISCANVSVSVGPGATVLTRTPVPANSPAQC
jgi:hypothetical protein